ncbi:hypothetical protein [Oleiharenicola sp. Vm1]|uniref:hypothetical protein n=1 Tax=Oleiharenicola sp. Vm1 TaxID=3398393 RepID=UPI0039F61881
MRLLPLLAFAAAGATLTAEPLSKQLEIDFFREVPNRNLKGFAVRSDGRLLVGPTLRDLPGSIPADLLWTFTRAGDDKAWLVGTGPEGKVFRVNTDVRTDYKPELALDLDATHVFALCALDGDAFLAGTSPQGTLALARGGKLVALAGLPADSIFDIARLPGPAAAVLVATGNPGRIYRVDLAKFAAAGEAKGKLATPADLAKHGITLFGEIRDRNVRRLLPSPTAASSPAPLRRATSTPSPPPAARRCCCSRTARPRSPTCWPTATVPSTPRSRSPAPPARPASTAPRRPPPRPRPRPTTRTTATRRGRRNSPAARSWSISPPTPCPRRSSRARTPRSTASPGTRTRPRAGSSSAAASRARSSPTRPRSAAA